MVLAVVLVSGDWRTGDHCERPPVCPETAREREKGVRTLHCKEEEKWVRQGSPATTHMSRLERLVLRKHVANPALEPVSGHKVQLCVGEHIMEGDINSLDMPDLGGLVALNLEIPPPLLEWRSVPLSRELDRVIPLALLVSQPANMVIRLVLSRKRAAVKALPLVIPQLGNQSVRPLGKKLNRSKSQGAAAAAARDQKEENVKLTVTTFIMVMN